MTGALGEAKVNELGRSQASSLIQETFHNPQSTFSVQHHGQSLVSSPYSSLKPIHNSIHNYVANLTIGNDATRAPTHVQRQISTPVNDCNTFALNITFDAERINFRDPTKTYDTTRVVMISTVSAPGTPPELTESRSSKSSSCGSDFSTEHESSQEIANINFEDIGLDDDDKSFTEKSRRDQGRTSTGAARDNHHTRRSALHKTQYQSRARILDGTSRGVVAPLKRGFTGPIITVDTQDSQNGPASPPRRLPRSTSSYSVDLGASVHSSSPRSSLAPSRRSSWQPQRKTIKELEAECHDSDEELPDDANLWNVPISPFHSANASPRSSFRYSPELESPRQGHQPLPLELIRSAPEQASRPGVSPSQPMSRHKFPPRSSSVQPPRSISTSPNMPNHFRNNRAKSWNLAMSDLCADARIISENLESHVNEARLKDQESGKPDRSSAPSTIKLPPIQRGTLDFMPISKEKEAVLSRTRPSWLPPKDPKEEQKHLKEYQRMMAASIEAERKKESRQKSIQCQKETVQASLDRIWEFYVNPETDISVIDRRVHDLCWRGIPPRLRGKVWQRAIGNPLGLTSKTYQRALERAEVIKSKDRGDLSQLERSIMSWFSDIDRDTDTALPELGLFQQDGPLRKDLINLCQAYACYRSDAGYFYGLQLIAALLLVQIPDPAEAFVFMANSLNRPIAMAFHGGDTAAMQRTYNRVVSNLGVKFPRLHDYLFESMERGGLGLTGQEIFEPMFRTLFSNGLDLDRLCRVWDVWIFEGDRTLIRTAVAALGSLQPQIFDVAGDLHLKRRNVQEMLGWGPFNRTGKGSYWTLDSLGGDEAFVDEIDAAGKLDYTGR